MAMIARSEGAGAACRLMLLFAVIAGLFHGRVLLSPLQDALSTAFSLSDGAMAMLQGPALTLPVALLAVPIGLVIDRWSRARLLALFALAGLAAAIATALLTSFSGLLAARALAGISASGANSVAFSMIADLVPPHQRGRSVMLISMGQYAGMASAFALGGFLLDHIGTGDSSLRVTMLLLSLPLLGAVAAAFGLREPNRHRTAARPSLGRVWADLWRERSTLFPILAAIAALEVALGGVLVWSAPALARTFDLPPAMIGSALATGLILSGIVGALGGGIITDLCQRRAGAAGTLRLLSCLLLVCGGACCFPLVPGAAGAASLLILALTGLAAAGVMAVALYTIVIPGHLRGLAMASLAAVGVVAFGTAPPLVSLCADHLGGPMRIGAALSLVCALSCLVAVLCLAVGHRAARRASPLEPDASLQ